MLLRTLHCLQQHPIHCHTLRTLSLGATMANSRFDYVREFERHDKLLPDCWIVVRIDGQEFDHFTTVHGYTKPNDDRGLNLMSHAAQTVMDEFTDIVLAHGQRDDYSFVLHKSSTLYNRRASKIASYINSLFTSAFCLNWAKWFDVQRQPIQTPPRFEASVRLYPSDSELRKYLCSCQAEGHIENLYNTAFWNLVQRGNLSHADATKRLSETLPADQNELLFAEFGINYNNETAMHRKGTVLVRKRVAVPEMGAKERLMVVPLYRDFKHDAFWVEHAEVLDKSAPRSLEMGDGVEENELVRRQIERLKLRRKVTQKSGEFEAGIQGKC